MGYPSQLRWKEPPGKLPVAYPAVLGLNLPLEEETGWKTKSAESQSPLNAQQYRQR
jgi:hypothetical protein